jgi:NAD-dependent deacetylase
MQWLICLKCRQKYPLELLTQNIPSADFVPDCQKCGGILKPDVIFFGETLPQKVLTMATKEAHECDLFIVIGSSLVVYPASYMPLYAKQAGAGIVIINLGETQQDDIADVIIDNSAGITMKKIMERLNDLMDGPKAACKIS